MKKPTLTMLITSLLVASVGVLYLTCLVGPHCEGNFGRREKATGGGMILKNAILI